MRAPSRLAEALQRARSHTAGRAARWGGPCGALHRSAPVAVQAEVLQQRERQVGGRGEGREAISARVQQRQRGQRRQRAGAARRAAQAGECIAARHQALQRAARLQAWV
jgi:hypothetical protein